MEVADKNTDSGKWVDGEWVEGPQVNKWKLKDPELCSYTAEATITRVVDGVFRVEYVDHGGKKRVDNQYYGLGAAKSAFTRKFANKSGLRCLWYPVED